MSGLEKEISIGGITKEQLITAYLHPECSHVPEMERVTMEILGVKWLNWRKLGTHLTLDANLEKPAITGVLNSSEANTKRREKSSL